MRESSPPEATRASGPSGCFGMARDAELDLLLAVARAVRRAASSAISNRPPAIASSCIAAVTRWASSLAGELAASSRADRRARAVVASASAARFASAATSADSAMRREPRPAFRASSSGSASGRTRCRRAASWIAVSRSSTRASSAGSRSSFCAVGAQCARGLVELDARGFEQRDDLAAAPDRAPRPPQPRDDHRAEAAGERGIAFGELVLAGARRFEQRRRVREARLRLRQRGPFVGGDVERRELAPARLEQLALGGERLRGPGRGVALARRRSRHAAMRRRLRAPATAKPPKASTSARCASAASSDWCACWPCRSTSSSPTSVELGERGRAAVDPRAALALRVERAPDAAASPSPVASSPASPCSASHAAHVGPVVDVERRGELGALRARPQLALLEAVAEQQRQRVEQDRLAGAGLAGEHGEAAIELEVERFDDDEIPDRQQAQHGCDWVRSTGRQPRSIRVTRWRSWSQSAGQPSRSGVSPQCSFSRSIAKWSWSSGCRSRTGYGARRIGHAIAFLRTAKCAWPSQWTAASLPLSSVIVIVAASLTAIGRLDSACGATGTSSDRRHLPDARSAPARTARRRSSRSAWRRSGRRRASRRRSGRRSRRRCRSCRRCVPRLTTTSFSASAASCAPSRVAHSARRAACAAPRRSVRRGSRRARLPSARSGMSVRKPSRPWLMPISGTSWAASWRAIESIVPSPPTTIATSTSAPSASGARGRIAGHRRVAGGLGVEHDLVPAAREEGGEPRSAARRWRGCRGGRSAQRGERRAASRGGCGHGRIKSHRMTGRRPTDGGPGVGMRPGAPS